jgi:hypothetical protein
MSRKNEELEMYATLKELIKLWSARYPELADLYHISNEGKRSPVVASKMLINKNMPDFCLPVAKGKYIGLYFEVKTPGKKPTKGQLEKLDHLSSLGHLTYWSDNLQEIFDRLLMYVKNGE